MKDLQERWSGMCFQLGVPREASSKAYEHLAEHYNQAHRLYHHLGHIRHCLEEFDHASQLAQDHYAVEVAIWYHDVVYDPARSDNEERSAEFAQEELQAMLQPIARINRVKTRIMATTHLANLKERDHQLIADIDLTPLAIPTPQFLENRRGIRSEYRHVPQDAFNEGTLRLFKRFLDRPTIYYLPYFQARCEAQARKNLELVVASIEEDTRIRL